MKLKSNSAGCDILENSIKVVSIVGPTASGKTKLAVKLAKKFDGEIVSADSMQIYKGMQIATAKPTFDETEGIKHHLIDFVSPDETYSVAMFVKDASNSIADINSRGKLPFIVGGTGLYVDSLLNNISFCEEQRDEKLSLELRKIYEEQGIDTLLKMLSEFDIDSVNRLKTERNLKRIIKGMREELITYLPFEEFILKDNELEEEEEENQSQEIKESDFEESGKEGEQV